MKITFLPKTRLGIWSCSLLVVFAVCIGVFYLMISVFGQRGGEGFFDNLFLVIPMLIAVGAIITAAAVGIISFVKSERAVLVLITVLIGLLVLWWSVAQVAFPH